MSATEGNNVPAARNENGTEAAPDQQQQAQAQAQPPRQSNWQMFQSVMTRMIIMYFAMNAMSYFRSKPVTPNTTGDVSSSSASSSYNEVPGNIFPKGSKFDMYVYLSESEKFKEFNDSSLLYWNLNKIDYGNWYDGENNDGVFTYAGNFPLTEVIKTCTFLTVTSFAITLKPGQDAIKIIF